ncbi:ROK family transcriptional regulator [Rugosimonospora africana]|uniref:Transcriptional regulator n=1 Tax=Rugosimonospora africana TaxID=556532 RepID=A0A8J3QW44_9ACTN|nr:ROK family transcriptional regulator [Rugosimonospora africana]GIH17459.1 transcriptional regulator [Rugosimonospora africana]
MTVDDAPGFAARGSARDLLRLVATGAAESRADLARLSGLSPSTVSQRVETLIGDGWLREVGEGKSRGGRRPRHLEIPGDGGVIGAIDLGAHHARVATLDLSGHVIASKSMAVEVHDGPEPVLGKLLAAVTELVGSGTGAALRGIGVGVPGPVEHSAGRIVSPSRMPGWNGFDVYRFCTDRVEVPIAVDNDANLMALGEHRSARADLDHAVYVKAGTGIGAGVISGGQLYRGAQGSAGDISHCRVVSADPAPLCSCGNTGCLEAVASGAALVQALAERGIPVTSPADVMRLVDHGDPHATAIVRSAGRYIGEILSVVVNFFNPQAVFIGGLLADCEPLLASMRASLYERCLPLATQTLLIERLSTGVDAGILGAAQLIIDRIIES